MHCQLGRVGAINLEQLEILLESLKIYWLNGNYGELAKASLREISNSNYVQIQEAYEL